MIGLCSIEGRLSSVLGVRDELIALNEPYAGVPAQAGVIVARRTKIVGFLVEGKRLKEQVVGMKARSRYVLRKPRLGESFTDNARVVSLFIWIANAAQNFLGLGRTDRIGSTESISQRQQQGS